MKYTFLIATHNRSREILRCIDSILQIGKYLSFPGEVIVVDDASDDLTIDVIQEQFKAEIDKGIIRCVQLEKNIGVTGARNAGIEVARGEWIVIVDSDDEIIPEMFQRVNEEIDSCNAVAAVFYRCIDFNDRLVGPARERTVFDAQDYMREGLPGECLTIIRKKTISKIPFNKNLRGFEGITYLEILLSGELFMLSQLILRRYRTGNADQLSGWRGRLLRSNELSQGYGIQIQMLQQHGFEVGLGLRLKKYFYRIIGIGHIFFKYYQRCLLAI